MKGGGDGQADGSISLFSTCSGCRCDGFGRPGQNNLLRAVDVGQHHVGNPFDQGFYLVDRCFDCQHGPRIALVSGFGHQAAARDTQVQKRFPVHPSGGVECRQFTVAVPAGGIRPQVKGLQNREHGQADRTDGGLGHIGPAKAIRLLLVAGKAGAWKKDFPQGRCLVKLPADRFNSVHGTGKTAGKIPAHVYILAPLAGKHEGGFSG